MYESCIRNGRCSDNGKLSLSGYYCFYLDSGKNNGINYFYSWKSFLSCFFGSLYVWCRYQLLRSYQKFIIVLFCILAFCFPVYAEDEQYNFQNIQNEALVLSGTNLFDDSYNTIIIDNEPTYRKLYSASNKSVSSGDNTVNRIGTLIPNASSPDNFRIVVSGSGYAFTNPDSSTGINTLEYGFLPLTHDANQTTVLYTRKIFDSGEDVTVNRVVLNNQDNSTDTFNVYFSFNNSGQFNTVTGGSFMTEYLAQVTTVFTWILSSITTLITFILGNPFLAVSLVLFMCGAVISFYVRIKNS